MIAFAGLALLCAGCGASDQARARSSARVAPLCGTRSHPPSVYAHVIWIWFENHSFDSVVGQRGSGVFSQSPYMNGTVARSCGLAVNYHSISHPSLPNYIAATSGATGGLARDCDPAVCPQSGPNLFSQLTTAGLTWRSYVESMPANCDLGESDLYVTMHNPSVFYPSLRRECRRWDVPLGRRKPSGAFFGDLHSDRLPAFAFVTPNICNDGHDCPVSTSDRWLSHWLPLIASSKAYHKGNTVVFITWDEGANGEQGENCPAQVGDASCHVATFVVSPYTRHGIRAAGMFDHYSLLKTTEQLLGLTKYLGAAGDPHTTGMRAVFGL